MIDQEILHKALNIAVKNGYKHPVVAIDDKNAGENIRERLSVRLTEPNYHYTHKHQDPVYYWFIFSHDFAKAFWGEKKVIEDDSSFNQWHGVTSLGGYSDWQVHLQRMVLEKEPLKYLEQFLEVKTS